MDFYGLNKQSEVLKDKIDLRFNQVRKHGQYILGPEVYELENCLKSYIGAKHCITCANGTDALQISLMALGIGPGDDVIVPAFSYIASGTAVKIVGGNPVFVDVHYETCNVSAKAVEKAITKNTKAILVVSLYGQCPDFNNLVKLAKIHDIPIIEDAAQSFGASYFGSKSCSIVEISCTSFFPTKPLGCYGDGGALFTNNDQLAEDIRLIARHGQKQKYHHERLGLNSRLDTLQAAILLEKLQLLDAEIQRKEKIAQLYNSQLSMLENIDIPVIEIGNKSAWAQYTIKAKQRDNLKSRLSEASVPTFIHYPTSLPNQKVFGINNNIFDRAEKLSKTVLSLPINAYSPIEEFYNVIDKVRQMVGYK